LFYPIKLQNTDQLITESAEKLLQYSKELAMMDKSACGISKQTRSAILATAIDIHAIISPLITSWREEFRIELESFQMTFQNNANKLEKPKKDRSFDRQLFAASLKAFYYFIRSLHDTAYMALSECLENNKPGKYSSMSKNCLKKGETSRVYKEVVSQLVRYEDWFKRTKRIRDNLKSGRISGSVLRHTFEETHYFLQFHKFIEKDDNSTENKVDFEIGLKEVLEAINFSISLIEAVKMRSPNHRDQL